MRCDALEGVPDVDLGTTSNADMESWKPKVDEFLHEFKDLSTKGWYPRSIGTLVERIQDEIDLALIRKCEHVLQATYQGNVTGMTHAIVMFLVEAGQYVTKGIGTSRELDKK